MKNRKIIYGLLLSFLFVFSGCENLDIENLNNPDSATVLATSDDIAGLAGGLMNNFIMAIHNNSTKSGMGLALWTAADQGSCSWGNQAMKDISSEPRAAWNNTPSYAYAATTKDTYQSLSGLNSLCNTILKQITNGAEVDPKVEAFARLLQGFSLGYLGLIFDKAFILDETTDLGTYEPVASPYADVIAAAVGHIDQAIAICNANTFTLDANWIPGSSWDNVKLAKLANSYAARFLVYGARNSTDNAAIDWNTVKTYATNGMDTDFVILGDGQTWYSDFQFYATYTGWSARTDMRIIHLLDPTQPDYYPLSGNYTDLPNDGVANSADARLALDFQYIGSQSFRPERGLYHFSNYRFKRIDDVTSNDAVGDFYDMRVTENEMLLAEAELRLGNPDVAANIVNASTRTTRGLLPDISNDPGEVEAAIFYEKEIECFCTGVGISFFDMRRRDLLQKGTPLHFPIPAQQLNVMQLPIYTFGGVANADGIGTSNGGWR